MTAACTTTYAFSGREDFTAYGTKGRFGMKPCYGYSNHAGWTSDPKIPLAFPQTDHFVNEMDAFSMAILAGKPFEPSGTDGLLEPGGSDHGVDWEDEGVDIRKCFPYFMQGER
jgi:predicted dehydrogenase